jgi:hypothetical protein
VRWLIEPCNKLGPDYSAEENAAFQRMSRDEKLAFLWDGLHKGAALFSDLWNADVPHIAVENPVMHKHAEALIRNFRQFSQTVQPWQFGEPQFKRTCFWTKGLPNLQHTNVLTPPKPGSDEHKAWSKVHRAAPGPNRAKERARFFPGLAAAMADQWGHHVLAQVQGLRRAA